MDEAIRAYVDQAIVFTPHKGRPLRVAATLMTCRIAVALLNAMHLREDAPSAYRHINVYNPAQPIRFDPHSGRWWCAPTIEEHPAWGINWRGAALLSEQLGARLPRVFEWEAFASNNDPARIYPWGNEPANLSLANYDEHFGGTTRVGSFPPSELGLYDLPGNLSEWCRDVYGDASSLERVAKGGAWSKDEHYLAIAATRGKWARLGTTTIGIRPVWDHR